VSVPAVFLPEAEDDIQAAHDHYERARPGLGGRFADAVRDRIDAICANPGLFAVFRRNVRAALSGASRSSSTTVIVGPIS
jgi:hypothetical protein